MIASRDHMTAIRAFMIGQVFNNFNCHYVVPAHAHRTDKYETAWVFGSNRLLQTYSG